MTTKSVSLWNTKKNKNLWLHCRAVSWHWESTEASTAHPFSWPALYREALGRAGLERLDTRRERITRETFEAIKDPGHLLHHLLPKRDITRATRDRYPFILQKYSTNRFCKSFINYCIKKKYWFYCTAIYFNEFVILRFLPPSCFYFMFLIFFGVNDCLNVLSCSRVFYHDVSSPTIEVAGHFK